MEDWKVGIIPAFAFKFLLANMRETFLADNLLHLDLITSDGLEKRLTPIRLEFI